MHVWKPDKIVIAILASSFIQIPVWYFFLSLESLVVGQGLIGIPNHFLTVMLLVLVVASVIIIFIGIPAYYFLARAELNNTLIVSSVGFSIPVIILIFINLIFGVSEGYSSGENYYGTYRNMIVDGERTFWGWIKLLESFFTFGLHGCIGALIFHKVLNSDSEEKGV